MVNQKTKRKARLLCVDDDPMILKIYGTHIEETGYELKTASTGDEGLTLARKYLPDLIISDVDMPGMDGFEFCEKAKADPTLSSTIFILASAAYVESEDAVRGLEIGADDYLVKPIKKQELLAKIKSFLRIKSLQDKISKSNRNLSRAIKQLKEYKSELETKNKTLFKEKKMLENSLKQISLLVEERERTNQELERFNQVQETNFASLIDLLSATIESKRQYHRGHSKKVAEMASFIAKELGLPEEDVRNIEIASLLHEIGKLSTPDDLAMKNPEDYSDAERNFLIQHPAKGAAMLEDFVGFVKISRIIRHFHERIDGAGAPDGLKGDRIPVGSRIISVANIFDNMVYRKKDGLVEEAFERIEDEIGTRFDARIVKLLHKFANMNPVSEEDRTEEVRLFELEPGMTLASGIFAVSGAKLLPRNTVLTEESLKQIANYNKMEPIEESIFIKQ